MVAGTQVAGDDSAPQVGRDRGDPRLCVGFPSGHAVILQYGRRFFGVAGGAGAGGAVFGRSLSQFRVAVTAEGVEGGLRRLGQVGAGGAMAVAATAEAGLVDKVVMAGDAADGRVFLVREVHG